MDIFYAILDTDVCVILEQRSTDTQDGTVSSKQGPAKYSLMLSSTFCRTQAFDF